MKRLRLMPQRSLTCLLLLAVLGIAVSNALAYWPTPAPTPPAKGAKIADPTWGNLIMRVTDSADGSNLGTSYSYWPTFSKNNGHIAFFNLDNGGSYCQDFDPVNFQLVGSKRALYATNPPSGGSPGWDDGIWSGSDDDYIFCHAGTYLWKYNVDTQAWTQVANLTGRFLAGTTMFVQQSKSANDDVFAFSLSNGSNKTGYGVYKVSTDQVLLNVSDSSHDEVQIDKSGRYLAAKQGDDTVKVYDLQLSTNTTLTDGSPDFAPGHSDNGTNFCAGHDNYNNQITFRNLGTPHSFTVLYNWGSNWAHAEHISFLADDENWITLSTYGEGTPPNNNERCEIFLVRTNATVEMRHICHHYSHYANYYDSPRANISRDGKYIAFTSNWGNSGRLDLWIVSVPPYGGGNPPVANFTGNPTSGNAPLTVAFTDQSTNTPTSWSWVFGDGGTSTTQSPSHIYNSAGNYTVTLTATNAYGSDGETKTNYISVGTPPSPPVAAFSGTPTSGTAPLAVAFTDSSTNSPTSWSWNFGDSSTSTAQNPSHTYAAGTYTVSLRATNAAGYDDEVKTNYITATSGGGSAPTFVAAGAVSSGTGTITPALPAGIATNDILLLFVETANQLSSITNQNGGTWGATPNSPQGTGTAGGTAATRLTVFWSRYNGTQGAPTVSDSGNHQAARMIAIRGCITSGNPWDVSGGTYEATVDTSGAIPGATTTVANTLVVAALATALPDASGTANFSSWANANLTSLTERTDNTVTAGNGGGLGIVTGVKATAGAYGNTTVTCGTATAKGLMSIALKPGGGGGSPPVANFSGTPVNGPASLAVSFTDSSTNTPTSWSWNFGDSATSTSQNPSHTYTTAGDYTVSLRATNAAGYDDEVKTNYITVSAANEVIVYPDTWTINWYTPGVTLISGGLSDLTTDNGVYMVTRCDTSTQRHGVMYTADTVYTPAQVSQITVEYQAKVSRSDNPTSGVVFTRKSDATWESRGSWLMGTSDTNWSWNTTAVSTYMDGSGVIGFEWCGCPANANNYDVSSDKMRFRLQLVTVQPPVAAFSGTPTSGTAPLNVAFTDASTNSPTSWSWNFGDGSTSTSQNPSHSFAAGTYTVSLRATNSAGYDDEVKTNYITANPSFVYVYPTAYNWHGNGVGTLISGGLSNLQASDDSYMRVRCNASNYNSGLRFEFNTGYTPAQVSQMTVEYEFHSTSASQPWYQDLIYKQDGSGGTTGMTGGLWTTTDQWMTWPTTAVSTHMTSGGYVHVTMCGCNQNSTTYDTYVDVVRLKLTLN